MIAYIVSFILLATAASVSAELDLTGVDPNTLSCADVAWDEVLHLPHFTDCRKFFSCEHGKETEFECAEGDIIFDFVNQVCNWTEVTECTLRTPIEDKPSLAGVDPNTLSCEDVAWNEQLLLPHFTDCRKFYMCVHGKETEFECASGDVIFDFVNQICSWTNETECLLRTPIDEEGSGWDEEDDTKFAWDSKVPVIDAVNVKEANNAFKGILDCNRAASASKQVAYKGDCQRYWKCVNGYAQSAYCSDGLFFNEQTQQCDFEANVKCNVAVEDELKGEFIEYK